MVRYEKTNTWLGVSAEDEFMMMHPETGAFQSLNITGAYLWDVLETPQSELSLRAALLQEFDATEEQAIADLRSFLADLLESGAIREQGKP